MLDYVGVSQAKLADVLEVSTSSLSRMLRGTQRPPYGFEQVLRVAVGPEVASQVMAAVTKATTR